jgi:hypothetical protein
VRHLHRLGSRTAMSRTHRARPWTRWLAGAIVGLTVTIVVVATSLGSAAATSPSVDVFVGYADSDRASVATFPIPWADPSNPVIIFKGCQPAARCSYDGGAVRLVNNNSAASVIVNSVKVEYSPRCVYDIWPHNITVAPGKQLILAQLTSGSDSGCTNTRSSTAPGYGHMDGSDIGPNGTGWVAVCDHSGVVPQVDVTLNGSTTTFTDTGLVLNTGGFDAAYCPGRPDGTGRNESIPWTPIGNVACAGATLALAPPTQSDIRGGIASVTASLHDGCGDPLQGSPLNFRVFGRNAPNSAEEGSGITDSQGNVNFTYPDTDAALGTDNVQASLSSPVGRLYSNVVLVRWVAGTSTVRRGVITKLSLRPTSFAAARLGASVAAGTKRRTPGTLVSYHDSQAAIATFTVLKLLPGRVRGKACVAPSSAGHNARRCQRAVQIGSFIHYDLAGANRFRFTGRVRGRTLRPGNYSLKVVAHNAGGAGPPAIKVFHVIRGR